MSNEGKYRENGAQKSLSAICANMRREQTQSPRPSVAYSLEPSSNEFEQAQLKPLPSPAKAEGLWMKIYQRPECQCSFEGNGRPNDLFDNENCPTIIPRDASVGIDARLYRNEDATTDPRNDASPRDTTRGHSADLKGRSRAPLSPAQIQEDILDISGINSLCLDSISLGDVSSQNGHAALPAAYVDKTRKEADATRIDSSSAPVTSRGSLQSSDSMEIDQIPMASGDWQVGSGVHASRDIQSNNLSLRAGTPDPVVSRTSNQLNNEDFSLGIDLDMGLPLLTEEEQLKQNHLLSIGLDIQTIGGFEQSSPRPLMAPSSTPSLSPKLENAGDSSKRAKIDPFSNVSGRTTPEEGLWMRRSKRNDRFVEMQEALYNLPLEEYQMPSSYATEELSVAFDDVRMTTRAGDSHTSSTSAPQDTVAKPELVSLRHSAIKRQAAYVDEAGDEAKIMSNHGLICAKTAPEVTQTPQYFDLCHIPMVCGKWNAQCNADRAGINQAAKLPATEGTAILDTVPKEDQRQSISWEHGGGIDLDAYLPEIPSAECLHYEARWKEAGRKQEAADARCLNDMFARPIEDGAIKPCSDAQFLHDMFTANRR